MREDVNVYTVISESLALTLSREVFYNSSLICHADDKNQL